MCRVNTQSCTDLGDGDDTSCWRMCIPLAKLVVACTNIFGAARLTDGLRRLEALARLDRVWSVFGQGLLLYAFADVLVLVGNYQNANTWGVLSLVTSWVCKIMFGYAALQPRFRAFARRFFASTRGATAIAAAIGDLLTNGANDDVLALARDRMRAISAHKITEQSMQGNTPDPTLFALSESARLGHVDAFLSHSWHDDPCAKWKKLQVWREEFKKKHLREPTLWVDKYCLDQTAIEESLKCLPVFLAGCSSLLVLCGETYLHRSWCLVELFVFTQMGGQLEHIEVLGVGMDGASLSIAAEAFDYAAAKCFTEYDTQRLRALLEICPGEVESVVKASFNAR